MIALSFALQPSELRLSAVCGATALAGWLLRSCTYCVKVIIALLPPLALEVHSSEVAMLGQISPLFLLSSLV